MRIPFLFFALLIIVSCKKKEACPVPKAGQTIVNDVLGQYSGYFKTTIQYDHGLTPPEDTSIVSQLYFYNTPTNNYEYQTSTVNNVNLNSYNYNYNDWWYECYIDNNLGNSLSAYASFFNNLVYSFNSPTFGSITFTDNRPGGNFSNSNSIPLIFSNSIPYIITLNNVTNCTKVLIGISDGSGIIERTVLPTNAVAKFYATEFLNTTPGNVSGLNISLINTIDTIINGHKFKLEKTIRHRYILTYTN